MNQKGFIQIPFLIITIISIVIVSTGTSLYFHNQEDGTAEEIATTTNSGATTTCSVCEPEIVIQEVIIQEPIEIIREVIVEVEKIVEVLVEVPVETIVYQTVEGDCPACAATPTCPVCEEPLSCNIGAVPEPEPEPESEPVGPGTLTVSLAPTLGDKNALDAVDERIGGDVNYLELVFKAGDEANIVMCAIGLTRDSSGIGYDSELKIQIISDKAYNDPSKGLVQFYTGQRKEFSNGYIRFSASDMNGCWWINKGEEQTLIVEAIRSVTNEIHKHSIGIASVDDILAIDVEANQPIIPTFISGPGSCSGLNASCANPEDAYEITLTPEP